MNKTNSLLLKMIDYYSGDPKRIQHFIKVHSFSKLIGELEGLDKSTQYLLETAAIVHDIGIKSAEEQFGNCNGKLQEQLGPSIVKEFLSELNYDTDIINRVCYLVGHHHTYSNIDGLDYQILVESDFLVNLYEDSLDDAAIRAAYKNIFRTKSGKQICQSMFGFAFY